MRAALPLSALLLASLLLAGCTALPAPLQPPGPARAPPAPAPPAGPAVGELRVHVVDVGQGDGVVWQLPGGAVVVYDCGPPAGAGANPVTRFLRERLGLQPGAEVWGLVVSHGHLDHLGGCEGVLEDYEVAHIYDAWYDGADATQAYRRFHEAALREGAALHTLGDAPGEAEVRFARGEALALPPPAREAGVRAEVLWPGSLAGVTWGSIHERSIAVRLTFGTFAGCFQGDLEAAEATLAREVAEARCDLLLVGHHGSGDSSGAAWLARMAPRVAVVSFGENAYGHPASDALCRVQQAGAKVYATQRLGDVTVSSDGAAVGVSPDRAETLDYCAAGASYRS